MKWSVMFCIALACVMTAALAAGQDPVERGRELFISKYLGNNGKSCNTCHPDGRTLEEAAGYEDEQLARFVNRCIRKGLGGYPLPFESREMKATSMYIRTFALP